MHEIPPPRGQAERWKLNIKDEIYLCGQQMYCRFRDGYLEAMMEQPCPCRAEKRLDHTVGTSLHRIESNSVWYVCTVKTPVT